MKTEVKLICSECGTEVELDECLNLEILKSQILAVKCSFCKDYRAVIINREVLEGAVSTGENKDDN